MHPYLRAYMAGIALPTMIVPIVLIALSLGAASHPFHLEDVVIFPIGLVPNAWGLWNMLYVAIRRRRDIPIGPYGAALVVVIAPIGLAIQAALDKFIWTPSLFAIGFPVALALYYLAWKYLVARINAVLGIA